MCIYTFPDGSVVKNLLSSSRCKFDPWVRMIPRRRKWQPTSVFLPGECHGKRILAGYSPWGCTRVRHDWVTKRQQQCVYIHIIFFLKSSFRFTAKPQWTALSSHTPTSTTVDILRKSGPLLQLTNYQWHISTTEDSVYIRVFLFVLDVLWVLRNVKYIHYHNIILNNFTVLKILCSLPSHLSFPPYL